jgi:type II secretory pathway component PulC
MKKLLLLAAVLFSFSVLTFAKSVTSKAAPVKKQADEFLKLNEDQTADVLANAGVSTKLAVKSALSNSSKTSAAIVTDVIVIETSDGILIVIISPNGDITIIFIPNLIAV